jgi:hypothetical protein
MDPEAGTAKLLTLYNVNQNEKGVREVLRALAKKVCSCQGSLDADTVSNVLSSLHNMSTRCWATREVLAALIPRPTRIHVRQVRISLYGLQSMSSDVQEVRDVLGALAPKIKPKISFAHKQ